MKQNEHRHICHFSGGGFRALGLGQVQTKSQVRQSKSYFKLGFVFLRGQSGSRALMKTSHCVASLHKENASQATGLPPL